MTETNDRGKLIVFRVLIVLVFLILTARLWRLQIVSGQQYTALAERNRFRLVSIPPLRGIISDRWGVVLARNTASYAVTVTPADLPDDEEARRRVYIRLGQLLGIPPFPQEGARTLPDRLPRPIKPTNIADMLREGIYNPFQPIYIKRNVDRDTAFVIEEQHLDLPGVQVVADPVREYPTGATTAHIVGYTGAIPPEDAAAYEAKGYNIFTDQIGLTGVEAVAEEYLHGEPGRKHIEVDIAGREMRTVSEGQPAIPGDQVVLALDADLQKFTEDALRRTLAEWGIQQGAVVVLNAQTGEVLAMVSLPNYDNNLFARGIDAKTYQALLDDPSRPLVNHAISAAQPPGSTFKVITAAGALQEKVITARTQFRCEGEMWVPNKFFPDDPTWPSGSCAGGSGAMATSTSSAGWPIPATSSSITRAVATWTGAGWAWRNSPNGRGGSAWARRRALTCRANRRGLCRRPTGSGSPIPSRGSLATRTTWPSARGSCWPRRSRWPTWRRPSPTGGRCTSRR